MVSDYHSSRERTIRLRSYVPGDQTPERGLCQFSLLTLVSVPGVKAERNHVSGTSTRPDALLLIFLAADAGPTRFVFACSNDFSGLFSAFGSWC